MKLTRVILSTCAVVSSVVCISAYSIASSEPSVSFTAVKPCSKETSPKPKVEILEPLGPLHDIAEPDILEAFKSRVGAMKASGDYDRRFNQNKERIAKELEHPTPVTRLKKATELRVWELSASVPETLPDSLLRQARSVPMPHLSRSLLFIDGTDAESLDAAQKLYQSQKDMRVVLVNGTRQKSRKSSIAVCFLTKAVRSSASSGLKPFQPFSLIVRKARPVPNLRPTNCPNSFL